ncbi:MAG: DNA-directed RNA polymerase subunit omega [Candidatus Saganbacteria bacterium]|nr:DNA-directed RNA polymerase subunit omega [Candidatus Saganbacteria bacterium]
MSQPTIDSLIKVTDNKYLLSNAIATRAKEISEGSIPYIDDFNPLNPIDTAMKEFAAGKLKIKILSGPVAKPLKVIEQKAKDFWTIDNLEKKEHKKAKKTKSK